MIPKSFRLMGQHWSVRVVPEKDWVGDENGGYCLHEQCAILVRDMPSPQVREQIFYHELAHALMNKMGETELDEDEKFIDLLGSLLHQVLSTCEGASKKAK
jgi:hypothetical protein